VKRVVHKARSHEEALRWDVRQQVSMTPQERMRIARILKDRAFPRDAMDVREWHRSQAAPKTPDESDPVKPGNGS